MKTFGFLVLTSAFWWSAAAQAEIFEKDLFACKSQVPGFETFKVQQATDMGAQGAVKTSYSVRTGNDVSPENWTENGEIHFLPESYLQFEGIFTRPVTTPETGEVGEIDQIFLSINRQGSGSLSVDGSLDPLTCQKAP